MTTFAPTFPNNFDDASLPVWRLSVERYHAMMSSGLITEEDRVELLDGLLVEIPPMNPPHAVIRNRVYRLLNSLPLTDFYVRSQQPITTETSEPLPDVMIIRGDDGRYLTRHPSPDEVPLFVAVSDSTLLRDQREKKRIYSSAGVAVYWIINIPESQLEIYSIPEGETYRRIDIYFADDMLPVVIEGEEIGRIPAKSLLPS